MTKKPHAAGPDHAGPAGGPPDPATCAEVVEGKAAEGEVVEGRVVEGEIVEGQVLEGEVVEGQAADQDQQQSGDLTASDRDGTPAQDATQWSEDHGTSPAASEQVTPETMTEADAEAAVEAVVEVVAELGMLRQQVDERTADLLRVTAEYANYRKRVDRDRALAADNATAAVLLSLLPVLDDLDRAREHGDLVGPFGSVAEQIITVLGKYSLAAFGAKGDPFDPKLHEAVAHMTSEDVTEPSCVDILRRGYMVGERLLRPALVAVADPG